LTLESSFVTDTSIGVVEGLAYSGGRMFGPGSH
jgi:hypothetical protein